MKDELIKKAYDIAVERYAAVGVDVNKALEDLQKISLSLHCWQADDVVGLKTQTDSCQVVFRLQVIILEKHVILMK
jgi:L-rhamnose isomerase